MESRTSDGRGKDGRELKSEMAAGKAKYLPPPLSFCSFTILLIFMGGFFCFVRSFLFVCVFVCLLYYSPHFSVVWLTNRYQILH